MYILHKILKNSFVKNLVDLNKYFFVHALLIIIFTMLYYYASLYSQNDNDKKVFGSTFEQTLYYTISTHFTIGFGDMRPESLIIRRLTMCQIVVAFLFFNI